MKFLILIFLILIFCTSTVSASLQIFNTPLGTGTPPATCYLSHGCNSVDYTAKQIDGTTIQFIDKSKGKETFIDWEFGDCTSLISKPGQKITSSMKNPVHKFPKKGYYIGMLAIKCTGYKGKLWVHKTIIIK